MFQLVYVSSATALFSRPELTALLEKSRDNNAKRQVSGILLYADGNFMQVLEGEQATVLDLYEKISRDPRHTGAIVLLRNQLPERQFPQWSMGFRDLKTPEVRALPGYSEFMNQPLNSDLTPGRAQQLLQVFRAKM